jgi:alpha-1,6-mannosyltransferase
VNLAYAPLAARGALLLALMAGGLLLHQAGARSIGSPLHVDLFVGLLGLAVLVYFSAVRLVLRRPQGGRAIWLVLGVAVIMRVVLITNPLLLSSDIYRYVWDGRVQAAAAMRARSIRPRRRWCSRSSAASARASSP